MKNKELKQFKLEDKIDFIVYLQELIVRTDKCLVKMKKYLSELEIEIKKTHESGRKDEAGVTVINAEIYSRYVDLIGNNTAYLLNLTGDQQKTSLSYIKFRKLVQTRRKRGSLDFEIRDIDEEIDELLKDLNKMRNWYNHVPESLLMSEIKLIKDGEFGGHSMNPIIINYYVTCQIEVVQDLFDSSSNFYKTCRDIHQSMKKDFSSLIGESVVIQRKDYEYSKNMKMFEATKLSAEIQGIMGERSTNQ